jgi:hypothetical protein
MRRPVRLTITGMAVLMALMLVPGAAEATTFRGFVVHDAVDATTGPPRIPTCANPYYGGKVKPKRWDAGCTGSYDLYRNVRWPWWSDRYARGRGISSNGYRVRVTAFRARMCISRGTEVRRLFYTRIRVKWEGLPAQTWRIPCHPYID